MEPFLRWGQVVGHSWRANPGYFSRVPKKNCRTSVEMIEKYYASHIKTSLDAIAINVMRPKKRKSKEASLTDVA
jgi:hypothetical protein